MKSRSGFLSAGFTNALLMDSPRCQGLGPEKFNRAEDRQQLGVCLSKHKSPLTVADHTMQLTTRVSVLIYLCSIFKL